MSRKFNYQRYLASREWGILKRQVRERSGGRCERGHIASATAVHHTTYERIGHEDLADLLHVCEACHEYLGGHIDVDPVEIADDEDEWVAPTRSEYVALEAMFSWFSGYPNRTVDFHDRLLEYLDGYALMLGLEPSDIIHAAKYIGS